MRKLTKRNAARIAELPSDRVPQQRHERDQCGQTDIPPQDHPAGMPQVAPSNSLPPGTSREHEHLGAIVPHRQAARHHKMGNVWPDRCTARRQHRKVVVDGFRACLLQHGLDQQRIPGVELDHPGRLQPGSGGALTRMKICPHATSHE